MVGVFVWLKNDEVLVGPCVKAVKEVFPEVEVYDLGSTDDSVSIVESLGVKVHKLGALDPKEYIVAKREIHSGFDYVFNVDADEIYPKDALTFIKGSISDGPARINGYWKMLKQVDGDLYVSSPRFTGEIAWDTRYFELRRVWPNETLMAIGGEAAYRRMPQITDSSIFCWHGVLLNRSKVRSLAREQKKMRRTEQFKDLSWEKIEHLPWKD